MQTQATSCSSNAGSMAAYHMSIRHIVDEHPYGTAVAVTPAHRPVADLASQTGKRAEQAGNQCGVVRRP
jgi:hypothetical protein